MRLTFMYYEVLRTFRNRRFFIFSLAFPLVLFFTVAGSNRHVSLDGISFPLYYMAGMASFGTMIAVLSSGGRISSERSIGWTRQMRITPLTPTEYFAAKVICGYLMALLSILVMALAGTSLGVRLSAGSWATMVGLILIALIPFTVLGIVLGHSMKPDSLGPIMGGITALFALLGGAWGPLATKGGLFQVEKALPSYWLVQAGKTAIGTGLWPAEGWIVLGIWTAAFAVIAVRVYQRDTSRV